MSLLKAKIDYAALLESELLEAELLELNRTEILQRLTLPAGGLKPTTLCFYGSNAVHCATCDRTNCK